MNADHQINLRRQDLALFAGHPASPGTLGDLEKLFARVEGHGPHRRKDDRGEDRADDDPEEPAATRSGWSRQTIFIMWMDVRESAGGSRDHEAIFNRRSRS